MQPEAAQIIVVCPRCHEIIYTGIVHDGHVCIPLPTGALLLVAGGVCGNCGAGWVLGKPRQVEQVRALRAVA